MSGQGPFRPSTNSHDWLGHGIYFFEESETFAVDWALGRVAALALQGVLDSHAVIAADLDLSGCLDLCSGDFSRDLARIHLTLPLPVRAQHAPRLTTAGGQQHTVGDVGMPLHSLSFNYTDTTVLNALVHDLKKNGTAITSKRAAFVDGDQLYTNSYFFRRSQVQIAVLDLAIVSNPVLVHPVSLATAGTNFSNGSP